MIENKHIVGFLDMKGFARGTWDPILLFVMGGGLLVSLISYEFVPGYSSMMVSVHKMMVVVFVCVYQSNFADMMHNLFHSIISIFHVSNLFRSSRTERLYWILLPFIARQRRQIQCTNK